jgi:NAD(P)-dependent dehydrogenase (short-subunit alcohol dehydrogenase family)
MDSRKNIVITGGNTGIGLETSKCLYADGHNIIFGSRNEQKNVSAAQLIIQSSPSSKGAVKWFPLDLSKRSSVE